VRGNIDAASDVPELRLIELMSGATLKLRMLLVHIAVYSAKLWAEVARVAVKECASLVVCGHSHVRGLPGGLRGRVPERAALRVPGRGV
jgi:predicted phosphodiesterase